MSDLPPPPRRSRSAPPARRAPRVLSRELIVDVALALLDEEGLDAVTMRRVAERLGTGPASLYAHVEDKDELVALLLDRVLTELQLPTRIDGRRWQRQVSQLCHTLRATFAAHRDIARATLGRVPTGERSMEFVEAMLATMRAGGVSEEVAGLAVDLLTLYSSAVAFEESIEVADKVDQDEFHVRLRSYFAALPPDRFPYTVAMAVALTEHDGDDRFDFGLDMIIGGIASTIKASGASGR